ncbi:entericidin A/B family lipoprotein [Phenylobacterium sp.]|jgi:predicted small secreted protein|uniref:entericidin A/B family lipoprotein n=1 Tax=Phenylobacterium sp. TaxID=1871053 RepID=UPI0037CC70CE
MRNLIAQALVPLVLIAAAISASGCNTIGGAGEDVSSTGKAVTDAARDVKDDMK